MGTDVSSIYSYNSFLYRKCHLCTSNPINLNIYRFCFLFQQLHYCRLTPLPALTSTSLRAVLWTLHPAQVQNMTCSLALTQERKHSIWCDAINFAIKAQWCVLNCDGRTQRHVARWWDQSTNQFFGLWLDVVLSLDVLWNLQFLQFIHPVFVSLPILIQRDKITELDPKVLLFQLDWEWG